MSNNNFIPKNSTNKNKKYIQLINIVILVILVAAVVILGYFSLYDKSDNSQNTANNVKQNNTLYNLDVYSEAQVAKDKVTLDSIGQVISTYKPGNLNSVFEISTEVDKFKVLIENINFFSQKYSADSLFINDINKIKNSIKQKQNYYYPFFRDAYCKVANRVMGEDNINSYLSGANNSVLELVSDRYLDSANIKMDFNILLPHLKLLRYKQIIFKDKNENTAIKTFRINSMNDNSVQ
jgi:hypothetical protein